MPGSYFLSAPDGLQPTAAASSPWSDQMLHGRLLGGLAARALEALASGTGTGTGFTPGRLTVDLFRAAPMEPVTVHPTPVRDGRRIRVADAVLRCGGHDVARASAVFLLSGDVPPGRVWQPNPWQVPPPDQVPRVEGQGPDPAWWDFRPIQGGFGSAERAQVWTCEQGRLVDDEVPSPFVLAALSADAASPIANSGDDGLHFINADYTLTLSRLPQGGWIGLESLQHQSAGGTALGSCTLYDLDGPFAVSTAVALANPPPRPT